MRIQRSRPASHFTQIPNSALRDERLSYTARGVLCELLSRPDGWDASADRMSDSAREHGREGRGEGRRAIRAAFAELEAAGYLSRQRVRDERGRIATVLLISDDPDRDTVSGTSVPPADTVQSPRSDRRTANRPPASGTSNRTLSTNNEHGLQDLASRRAREKHAGANRHSIAAIIRDVRAAVAQVDGEREAVILSDEEALGLYATYVTGGARSDIHDLTAYMAKIIGDCSGLDGALGNAEPVCLGCRHWESQCSCPAAPGQPAA